MLPYMLTSNLHSQTTLIEGREKILLFLMAYPVFQVPMEGQGHKDLQGLMEEVDKAAPEGLKEREVLMEIKGKKAIRVY